ncbi:MAG: TRAP transporter substrate-binding protein [Clostridiaceae bacterium]|nr:TRAP transporter substrate-binding protein [Clostridiaceae bacterium]
MSKKLGAIFCSLVMLVGIFTGCSNAGPIKPDESTSTKTTSAGEPATDIEPITIKWASQNNPVMASGKTSLFTVEEIERLSDGKIIVEYHDQGQLGYDAELIQQVLDGTIPIVTVGVGIFSQYTDIMEAIQLPFLITSYEQEYEVVRSQEFLDLLDATGEKLGLKLIGTQENGIRHFANNVKPINTVEDLAGMKIRVPQTTILMTTMDALGANPIPLAYNEIYTALQNNIVNGEEINFTSMEAQKHYEVVDYVSTIGFYPYMAVTAINLDYWNTLSAAQQDVITQALLIAEEKCFTGWIQENDAEARIICEEQGVEINEIADVDSFRNAISSLYDEYRAKSDLVKAFIESVESMN